MKKDPALRLRRSGSFLCFRVTAASATCARDWDAREAEISDRLLAEFLPCSVGFRPETDSLPNGDKLPSGK
jgi:hypothetical protein